MTVEPDRRDDSILETHRLALEPILREHAPLLFPILLDERIYRYIPTEAPASVAALESRYARLQTRESPDRREKWLNWALRWKSQARYIGTVQATVAQDGSARIAYELAPAFWGNGFAAEACSRMLQFLFETYRLSRIIAEVDTRNAASCRLLERLGFERVATIPQADYFKGASSDEYRYELRPPGQDSSWVHPTPFAWWA